MRLSRIRVALAALAGAGLSLAIAFAPRAFPEVVPAAAPVRASIVLDAGMITDAARPVDAAP